MHRNFFKVEANNYYELGKQQGILFREYAHKIRKEQPDLPQKMKVAEPLLALHKSEFPQYMEELQGYADGAGIPLLDLFTIAIEDDAEVQIENVPAKCTSIFAFDEKIFAHNEDVAYHDNGNEVCLLQKTIDGVSTLELFYLNTIGGTAIGINSFGVIHAVNSLIDSPCTEYGISKSFIARAMLDSKDPFAVYNRYLSIERKSGFNHSILTKEGRYYNIEFLPNGSVVKEINANYVHTNHCVGDEKVTLQNECAGTLTRLNLGYQLLSTSENTVEKMKSILLNDVDGPEKGIMNSSNIANAIIDLNSWTLHLRLLSELDKGWEQYDLRTLLQF